MFANSRDRINQVKLSTLLLCISACSDTPMQLSTSMGGMDAMGQMMAPNQGGIEDSALPRPPARDGEVLNPFSPRPMTQTCTLPPPPPVGELRLVPATNHSFQRPLWYGEPALLSPWSLVAEQGGKIFAYDEDRLNDEPTLFFDISVSRAGSEEGLLGLAFHPKLRSNPYLYTYYSSSGCNETNAARCSVLSRWRLQDVAQGNQQLPSVDQNSEFILMEIPQPYANHNGGDIRFGPDGYLYISLGDGGSAGDPVNHAQRPETLLGSMLRIDVDATDPMCGKNYEVPSDNPFVTNRCGDGDGGLPEVWAWGLRNSWRMSFDRETGDLWAADVGQDQWEEVNRIQGGKNYGWRPVEGPECYTNGCDLSAYEPPVHSYNHDIGRSITGGFVYRGEALPGLRGYYVFSDFETSKVMAFPLETPENRLILAVSNARFTSFGETAEGELRLLTFDTPSVLKFDQAEQREVEVDFPTRLSETGCYQDISQGTIAPSVVPYYVNIPFWSDEAEKERAFALPVGTKMTLKEAGVGVDLPIGTVLIKTFYLTSTEGVRRRFETRLMHYSERGWTGYTYRWNEDQSDAELLTSPEITPYQGPRGEQAWAFLGQSECLRCHTAASNRALGMEVQQLNRRVQREDGWYEQLTAFAEADYISLSSDPSDLASFRELSNEEDSRAEGEPRSTDLTLQARAYLHINCSPCHRPDAAATVEIDLRNDTPLIDTGLCNIEPLHGDLNVVGAKHLVPGDPERSLIVLRSNRRDEEQMPPVGSHLVDFNGVALLSLWISQLQACE
jgi:uncharacterized repeat protein (TIGR03806 family)